MAFLVKHDGSVGNGNSPAIGTAASKMPYFDTSTVVLSSDSLVGTNGKAERLNRSSLRPSTAEDDDGVRTQARDRVLGDVGAGVGEHVKFDGGKSDTNSHRLQAGESVHSTDGGSRREATAPSANGGGGRSEGGRAVPASAEESLDHCRLAVSFDFPNGKQLIDDNAAKATAGRDVPTSLGSLSLGSLSLSDKEERMPTNSRDEKEILQSLGFDISSATPLERAVMSRLVSSPEPILLTSLASLPELRSLAISEGKELRKPFFAERPHLFRCVQEDRFTTRIALAQPSRDGDGTSGMGHSSPVMIPGTSSQTPESTSSSLGSSTDFPVSQVPRSGRQAALKQLEEDIAEFIRMSEQRSVFLGRFGGIQALKRLAHRAGVELKKPFFSERPNLFRCVQETSGTINVILAEDAEKEKDSSDLSGDVWSSDSWEGDNEEEEEEYGDETESSDDDNEEDDSCKSTQTAKGGQMVLDKRLPSAMRLIQEMADAAVAFVYQSVGKGKILLALFGQNRHLKKVAAKAKTPWRKPFFVEHSHFFKCISQGVSAFSIQLTEAGVNRARHLYQGGYSIPLNPGEDTAVEHQPLSAIQRLERSLVKFLQEQENQTSFLHVPAADLKLQRLAVAAGEVLRKPFYESRLHLFRTKYINPSTVVVTLAPNAAQNLRPNYHRMADQKPTESKVSTNTAGQLLENAIADYLLASQQEAVYLSQLASDFRLQEMAQAASTHINKAFFVERPHLFTINKIGTQAAKLVISLNLGKIASKLPTKTPMSSVPLPSGPALRRLENAAVSLLVQLGQPVPMSRLCTDQTLIGLAEHAANLNAAFFKNRPHLFHCQSEGDVTTVGLPMSVGHLKSLEKAVEQFLLNYDGKVELGIVGNDKHLAALGSKVALGLQITKSFFLARPHQFRVIQRGSRTEVTLAIESRGVLRKSTPKPAPSFAAKVTSSAIGSSLSAVAPSKDISLDTLDKWPTVTRWEDLYQLTQQAVSKASQAEDKDDTNGSAWPPLSSAESSAESSAAPGRPVAAGPSMTQSQTAPLQPHKNASSTESTSQQWSLKNGALQSGYTNGSGVGPSYLDTTLQSGMTGDAQSVWSGYESSGLSGSAVVSAPVDGSTRWDDYSWYGTNPVQSSVSTSNSMHPTFETESSVKVLPTLTENQLDVAERQLLSTAPSLAYTLRLHRMDNLDSMLESLQLDRLRAELLQLQLSRGQPVLTMQETYYTTADSSGSLEQAYQIEVILGGESMGKGKGSWKAAKIKAIVEAAARLSLL